MHLPTAFIWFVTFTLAFVTSQKHPGDKPAPRYVINLDLAPEKRWAHIAPDFKTPLEKILVWVEKELAPLKKFSERLQNATKMPQEYVDEIRGLAESANLKFEDVYQANFLYELTHGVDSNMCTSIVAEKSNGTIMHVRNMDLSYPGLDNITIDIEFQRNGKTVYYGTTFVGYVGLPTGMHANGYSVVAHTRFQLHSEDDCIAAAEKGGQVIGQNIRSVLNTYSDWSAATKKLETEEFIINCYLISAGLKHNEGKVITRNMDDSQDIWQLTDERWFEVETNFDHWKIPLDGRRHFAYKEMNKTTAEKVDMDYLYKIVSTPPDYAGDTVYTTKMVPSLNMYQSTIRGHGH